jgi:hypothetical protein
MTSPNNSPHRHGIRVNQAYPPFRALLTSRLRLLQLREAPERVKGFETTAVRN